MPMNELNAQQIVLLCLLVSFVSSIATGITTVSLLGQSPEPVSQTINRVVEKTIERVVESPQENNTPPERIVETVVVNQEDLTVEAVAKNSRSLVRIFNEDRNGTRTFLGLGVVVSESGNVVTENTVTGSNKLVGVFASGEFELEVSSTLGSFKLLKVKEVGEQKFSPATLADSQNLKLAQSVILLSGRQNNVVSSGIINDLITSSSGEDASVSSISSINAGVDVNKVLIGSILLNLQGDVVGIKIGSGTADNANFLPSNALKDFLSGIQN